jgi:hypothetical protein
MRARFLKAQPMPVQSIFMGDEKNLVGMGTHPALRAPLLGGDLHAGFDWDGFIIDAPQLPSQIKKVN